MEPFLDKKDINTDELPPEIAYHLDLLSLLSKLGKRVNYSFHHSERCLSLMPIYHCYFCFYITAIGFQGAIEAKLQSIYSAVDVLDALTDPRCILLGKIRLATFFYRVVVEVETRVPFLNESPAMWMFLEHTEIVLKKGLTDLSFIENNSCVHQNAHRQSVEYMIVCIMIIKGFFTNYFDTKLFTEKAHHRDNVRVSVAQDKVVEVMKALSHSLIAVYVRKVSYAGAAVNETVRNLLQLMKKQLHDMSVEIKSLPFDDVAETKTEPHSVTFSRQNSSASLTERMVDFSLLAPILKKAPSLKKMSSIASLKSDDRFGTFKAEVASAVAVKREDLAQYEDLCDTLLALPRKGDSVSSEGSDLRLEPLIAHLVHHVQHCVETVVHGQEITKRVPEECTVTSVWVLNLLRAMIERRWGMTVFERDDDGGEEQDDLAAFLECGVPQLCLDMIANGIDNELQVAATALLVALLFKEGGNLPIQRAVYDHLSKAGSDLFFEEINHTIKDITAWFTRPIIDLQKEVLAEEMIEEKSQAEMREEREQEDRLKTANMTLRFLQLLCEGHFEPNQNILREQPLNRNGVNLLATLVESLDALEAYKFRDGATVTVSSKLCAMILESIQGPCVRNQLFYAEESKLLEILNKRVRSRVVIGNGSGDDEEELKASETELKKVSIEILQSLLEGQRKP
jgi:hypothetical protein